jgi:tetratricopeptide (TPR) repeat protein
MLNYDEIMAEIDKIAVAYRSGNYRQSLDMALVLRRTIDTDLEHYKEAFPQFEHLDRGLNAQIYNCMKLLKQYDGMIPFLESTINYLDNNQNPTLWRLLGLLYLIQEDDLEKACEAWKEALTLDSSLVQKYPGLNIVFVFDSMKKAGKKPSWKVLSADIESGDFSVELDKS